MTKITILKAKVKLEYYAYLSRPESGTKTGKNYSFEQYCLDNSLEVENIILIASL